MALAQPLRDLLGGAVHDREVRLALLRERCRQRDQDRVGVAQLVVVGRRAQPVVVHEPLQRLGGDVLDVALATVEHRHPLGVAVDEKHAAARLGEHLGEWDADVAGSDDGDVGHRRAIVQRGADLGLPDTCCCCWLLSFAAGPLAQLVEQGTLNPKVEGSNPSRPTLPRR